MTSIFRFVLTLTACLFVTFGQTNGQAPCWFRVPDTNTRGGSAQAFNTLTDCQNGCNNLPSCQATGFDWNPNNIPGQNQSCFFSNSNTTQPFTGIDHYIYNGTSCTTGTIVTSPVPTPSISWVCNTFNKTTNTHNIGGTSRPAASQVDCENQCKQNTTCGYVNGFGYDWNSGAPAGQQCWFANDASFQGGPTGIDHYTPICVIGTSSTNLPGGFGSGCIQTRILTQGVIIFSTLVFNFL